MAACLLFTERSRVMDRDVDALAIAVPFGFVSINCFSLLSKEEVIWVLNRGDTFYAATLNCLVDAPNSKARVIPT